LQTPRRGCYHTEAATLQGFSTKGGRHPYGSVHPWTLSIDSPMIEDQEDNAESVDDVSTASSSQSEVDEDDDSDNEVKNEPVDEEANFYGNRIICFDNLKFAIEENFVCRECMFRERSFATRLNLGKSIVTEVTYSLATEITISCSCQDSRYQKHVVSVIPEKSKNEN
jgi:hypothetical protein